MAHRETDISDDDDRSWLYSSLDPRSRFNPPWWYACWWISTLMNVFILVDVLLEMVGLVPGLNTWPLSALAMILLIPVALFSTARVWESNAKFRVRGAEVLAEHQPDQHGYCTACQPLCMWPCPFFELYTTLVAGSQQSRTERLYRWVRR